MFETREKEISSEHGQRRDEYLLEADKINAGYSKSQILFDVSLRVKRGSITGLIGPNGSGKSTVLKSIFGLTNIYSGSITLGGKNIGGKKPFQIARLGIAYLPQVDNTYSRLTVRENLVMAAYSLSPQDVESRMKEVLEFFPMLKSCLKRKALVLSGGQRQMLAMAAALMTNPVLMMLDEPATNLAPKIEDMVFEKIKYLNTSMDMTIFVVEQHVKKLLEICEAVYVLVTGKVRFNGTAEELAKSQKMFEVFIGVSDL